jgi:DinB superfamily
MKKNTIAPLPVFFDRYINLVSPELDLENALKDFSPEKVFDKKQLETIGSKIYAPEKWTVKTILQHCIDTERIMAYRAMRFARNDTTILPGFDEELFGKNCEAETRNLDTILQEFTLLRQSTVLLFNSFSDEMMHRKGHAFKSDISVLHLGFVIVGHSIHHQNIIQERYASL